MTRRGSRQTCAKKKEGLTMPSDSSFDAARSFTALNNQRSAQLDRARASFALSDVPPVAQGKLQYVEAHGTKIEVKLGWSGIYAKVTFDGPQKPTIDAYEWLGTTDGEHRVAELTAQQARELSQLPLPAGVSAQLKNRLAAALARASVGR
jgi:hypothetical protein